MPASKSVLKRVEDGGVDALGVVEDEEVVRAVDAERVERVLRREALGVPDLGLPDPVEGERPAAERDPGPTVDTAELPPQVYLELSFRRRDGKDASRVVRVEEPWYNAASDERFARADATGYNRFLVVSHRPHDFFLHSPSLDAKDVAEIPGRVTQAPLLELQGQLLVRRRTVGSW